MRTLWTRHWAPWAWLDVLAKRALELVVAYGLLWLLVLWLQRVVPDGGTLADASSRPYVLLVPILAALFLFLRGVYRVIVHPIRAAVTGRFLDQEARVGIPAYRGVPPEASAVPPAVPQEIPTTHSTEER